MLKDGTYAAWYKTPLDQGTGIVHVADGQIWGLRQPDDLSRLLQGRRRSLHRHRHQEITANTKADLP